MKVLFDTNIVLDLLLARQPFVADAARLFAKIELGELDGYLCTTTITTVYYLVARSLNAGHATSGINRLLRLFEVAAVSRPVLAAALTLSFRDFEDAVLHEAARLAGVDAIVTRDLADFAQAQLPVYDPPTLLALLQTQSST
jgi:predicted nucleic acid-binding protein